MGFKRCDREYSTPCNVVTALWLIAATIFSILAVMSCEFVKVRMIIIIHQQQMAPTAIVFILRHQITILSNPPYTYQLTSLLMCMYEYLGRAEEERSPMVYIHLEYWVVIAPAILMDSTSSVGFTVGPPFAVVSIIYIIYSKS